jgi:O-antigen/teichoic acid export membrane protein
LKKYIADSYRKLRATSILSNFFNLSGIQLANILLLILIIPIVTRSIGIAAFGIVMFANRFSQLAGSVINWGTSQSGVRDVAFNLNDPKKLSAVFYNTLYIRIVIFIVFLLLLLSLHWVRSNYYIYILFAAPIALAEVFNPLCFFIGVQKLRLFNIYNLVFNIVCVFTLVVFIKGPGNAVWVNFILGMANVITYLMLMVHFKSRFKLPFYFPSKAGLLKTGKENFYLTVNNISGNLQQSIIIFALPRWGYAVLLGPYTLCDRIIGQCRNLLIIVSNAVYPNAAIVYQESAALWNVYRRKTKYLLEAVFFAGAILIFVMADFIVFTLSKEHNATAVLFLRIMAFVPTISALNVVNILDQLLKKNNVYIFRIAMVLVGISLIVAFVLLNIGNYRLIGAFTLIIEASSWLLYEFIVRKTSLQNA